MVSSFLNIYPSIVNKQGKVLAIGLGVFSTKVKKKENFLLKKMKLTPDI